MKKDNKENLEDLFEAFLEKVQTFPESLDISAIRYNLQVLADVIIRKEFENTSRNESLSWDKFTPVSDELSKLVHQILKSPNVELLKQYHNLEEKLIFEFSGLFLQFTKQAALSVKALYYYKIGNYDRALNETLECISLNEKLIENNLPSLVLRCLEQNRNLAKIFIRKGLPSKGNQLLKNIFNYLLTGQSNELYGLRADDQNFPKLNPVFREYCLYDMFLITAGENFTLSKFTDGKTPNEWMPDITFTANNLDRQILYNWIYIRLQTKKLSREYFESLSYFFEEPLSKSYEVLKMILLQDLINDAEAGGYLNINLLKKKIVRYIETSFIDIPKKAHYLSFFDSGDSHKNLAIN